MEDIKKEIDLKIIKPIEHRDLYKAYGKKLVAEFYYTVRQVVEKHILRELLREKSMQILSVLASMIFWICGLGIQKKTCMKSLKPLEKYAVCHFYR